MSNKTPYEAVQKLAEGVRKAMGIPERKEPYYEEYDDEEYNNETKDNDLRFTIDPNIFLHIDSLVHGIYREKKELERLKIKKALTITTFVCTTVMVVSIVISTFWGW